ncbi:hypothetical protein HBJ16_004255, partial [Pseudomonas sp. CES]
TLTISVLLDRFSVGMGISGLCGFE